MIHSTQLNQLDTYAIPFFRCPKNIISIQCVIIACIACHYHNNKHVYIVYMPDIFALFSNMFPNNNKSQ